MHPCEAAQEAKMQQIHEFIAQGYKVLDVPLDICDQNGWYKSVQEDFDL